jgi:hypothetical protein
LQVRIIPRIRLFARNDPEVLIEEVTPDFHASATPDEMVARIRGSCDADVSVVIFEDAVSDRVADLAGMRRIV